MTVIEKGALQLSLFKGGLRLRATENRCFNEHVSLQELGSLGLAVAPSPDELPGSELLRRAAFEVRAPDREPIGPAIAEPGFVAPLGQRAGDFRLVLVREGLDVYVDDYGPCDSLVSAESLRRLGLVPWRALLENWTDPFEEDSPEEERRLEYATEHAAELLAAFDRAVASLPAGEPAPVAVLRLRPKRIEVVRLRSFLGRFSAPGPRAVAAAVHDDAEALGRVQLFLPGEDCFQFFHAHLVRADAAPARAVAPTAWGLTLWELAGTHQPREEFVRRSARLVRLLPPGDACLGCERPLRRRSYHVFAPDEDVLVLEGCPACGEERTGWKVRLVDLTPEQLARFLPPDLVGKIAVASALDAKARSRRRAGKGGSR